MVSDLKIGQLFMIRFQGVEPSAEVIRLIQERNIGGVILFASNCPSIHKTVELVGKLKSHAKNFPLCVAIDHEGGRVHRLPKPVTHFPPMRLLGKLAEKMPSANLAWDVGRAMGRELKAIGIDLNFAPVVDVDTNSFNPVIGDRAFSRNAEVVAMAARQFIQGLQEAKVAGCAKHFPGHGDTDEDSHEVLPRLPHNLKRLHALELIPFKAAIEAGVASIMPAHVVYDGIDHGLPATFSLKLLRDLLRNELRFEGVIISDDLTMGAIAKNGSMEEACVKAFVAGCDWLMVTTTDLKKVGSVIDFFSRAVDQGKIPMERVENALKKVAQFKEKFCAAGVGTPNLKVVGSKEHVYLLNKIKQLA